MATNYERIKAMSVKEMAEWLKQYISCEKCPQSDFCTDNFTTVDECNEVFENWLENETENDR